MNCLRCDPGRLLELRKSLSDKLGVRYTATGAFIGPFMGVTFSMAAATYTQTGIAQTSMSLIPVFTIQMVWFFMARGPAGAAYLGLQ